MADFSFKCAICCSPCLTWHLRDTIPFSKNTTSEIGSCLSSETSSTVYICLCSLVISLVVFYKFLRLLGPIAFCYLQELSQTPFLASVPRSHVSALDWGGGYSFLMCINHKHSSGWVTLTLSSSVSGVQWVLHKVS